MVSARVVRDNRFSLVIRRLLAWQSRKRRSWRDRVGHARARLGRVFKADDLAREVRRWRQGGPAASRVPLRWVRRPTVAAGDRICLFVLLPRGGALLPHSLDHLAAWRAAGYAVVAIVAADAADQNIDLSPLADADGLAVRANRGYDFGAWAAVIQELGEPLSQMRTVAIANDSVLGPSKRFAAMLDRVDRSGADVVGLIESQEVRRHLQSFTVFFKPRALRSTKFLRFWRAVRSGDRQYVIDFYELTMLESLTRGGLTIDVLFRVDDNSVNPTLTAWRALIDAGFPYLKVQLLRDNPNAVSMDQWRDAAASGGFDLGQLDDQIAALKRSGDGRWCV